jgi:putative Holliday junction resolvase
VTNAPARILALDIGRKRIGVAITDEMGWGAQGLEAVERQGLREDLERLSRIVSERRVGLILAGLPLHMDGRQSAMGAEARRVALKLGEITGIPVEMRDERLTSVEAQERLAARGWNQKRYQKEKKRGAVDRMAAMILLEDYLRTKEAER